jgi:hypothetical protein
MIRRNSKDRTDPSAATTYFQRAAADDELGGRFAGQPTVIGATPDAGALYPAASDAQANPVPPEEPTGVAIDAQEPVGEMHEIEASLARIERERGGDA